MTDRSHVPPIGLFVARPGALQPAGRKILETPVPLDRPGIDEPAHGSITYGDYLGFVRQVTEERWEELAMASRSLFSFPDPSVRQVRIISEKHGSDYHPARIELLSELETVSFVMNVALTERGLARLASEFEVLKRLEENFKRRFLPRAHFMAEVGECAESASAQPVRMFLGEWFDGHHEFHASMESPIAPGGAALWDMDSSPRPIDARQVSEIHRKCAYILSYYYECDTFHEIYPWHHASGDFVASVNPAAINVRLVTARQHAPRIEFDSDSPQNRCDGLMLFLVNLSIRMRLDRLDGTGEIAWAHKQCVQSTVQGCFEALQGKVETGEMDPTLFTAFAREAAAVSPADLANLVQAVVASYDPDSPDMPAILSGLAEHTLELFKTLRSIAAQIKL